MTSLFDTAKAQHHALPISKGFYVYFGYAKGTTEIVYVGTTTQKPTDRFRWHKANGKDLKFEVVNTCKDADEMLDIEFDLIQMHKPRMNKIMKRKQNYNAPLAAGTTQTRVGDKTWCQRCFKRHVNPGYTYCTWCS